MTLLPKVKLKTVPQFPANIIGGAGIEVTKESGHVTVDLAFNDFSTISAIPTSPNNNVLTYDTGTGIYAMLPTDLLGGASAGIADAANDGHLYGRQSAAWSRIEYQQSGTQTVVRSLNDKDRDTFAVKDFNIGVIVNDDTAALQAAVNEAMKNGRRFHLPFDRDIYITQPIVIQVKSPVTYPSPITDQFFNNYCPMQMIGSGRRKIKAAPSFSGDSMLHFTYDAVNGYVGPHWSELYQVNLDGMGVAPVGVWFDYLIYTKIAHSGITGTNVGVRFTGTGGCEIQHSVFRNPSRAIDFTDGGGDTWIRMCDFYCGGAAIHTGANGGNMTVDSNVFDRIDAETSATNLIGINIASAGSTTRDIRIINNEFSGMQYGIYAAGTSSAVRDCVRLRIVGNQIVASSGGAVNQQALCNLSNVRETIIHGNNIGSVYLSGGSSTGIPITMSNCNDINITGNVFSNLARPAIAVQNAEGLNISNNTFRNVGREAVGSTFIFLDTVTDSAISCNTAIQDSGAYGQTFVTEAGASTRNRGVGNVTRGVTNMLFPAGGSTSSIT